MSALNEALQAAQRQALAAMQRAYLAGVMDVDEVSENLDAIDLRDVIQRATLLNAWAICKSLGATETVGSSRPAVFDEGASQPQLDLIARLADERGTVLEIPPGLTKAGASDMITKLQRMKPGDKVPF